MNREEDTYEECITASCAQRECVLSPAQGAALRNSRGSFDLPQLFALSVLLLTLPRYNVENIIVLRYAMWHKISETAPLKFATCLPNSAHAPNHVQSRAFLRRLETCHSSQAG